MSSLKMFCLTVNPDHLKIIKELNYLPAGLGEADFSSEWFKDNKGENISSWTICNLTIIIKSPA